MSVFDELRDELRKVLTWRRAAEEMYYGDDVHRIIDTLEAKHTELVDSHEGPCACSCGAIYWKGEVLPVCPKCGKE